MRTLLIVFAGVALTLMVSAQKPDGPQIRFAPTEINLGKVAVDKVTNDLGKIEIVVHNDGNRPLIISNTTACCGTRVNEWPREPIAPGGNAKIKAEFRVEARPYRISRSLTVQSNATNGESQRIAILGEVVVAPSPNEIAL